MIFFPLSSFNSHLPIESSISLHFANLETGYEKKSGVLIKDIKPGNGSAEKPVLGLWLNNSWGVGVSDIYSVCLFL